MSMWISGAKRRDLTSLGHHNGRFGAFYGVILHVNVSGKQSQGTSPDWYAAGGGPDQVCPNFQVMRDGTIWQLLPMDVQPWTQADGNYNYASIETGGDPDEPLTPEQLRSCAVIVRAYHERMGMPLRIANKPGQQGLGVHSMGGAAWGGHSCPGEIRAAQRRQILTLAATSSTNTQGEFTMDADAKARFDKIDAALARLPKDVLSADVVPIGTDPKNPTWATSSALGYLVRHVAALNPATLAKAIAAALPANVGNLTADQLEAAVEAGVRTVFADAGSQS